MKFDRLAPHYDWMEAFTAGDRLQRARTHWIEALSDRRNILSAGEGPGRFAASCLARYPGSKLTCLEASAGMLKRAQARTRGLGGNVAWIHGDARQWTAAPQFDAIVTCFFLDCFPPEEADAVVARLAGAATPEAVWIVVDFAVPSAGPARWRALAVHWIMYRFFRLAVALPAHRLTPPEPMLGRHGFRLAGRQEFNWGLIRADHWVRIGAAG